VTRLYLVRHGATEWNRERRAQGVADVDLNEDGRRQAAATAELFRDVPLTAVYSSDLKRASDTAEAIARPHGLTVITDPDLREIDQGEWTGVEVSEIAKRWPDTWGPARHYSARPGGESPQQVRARALRAVRRVTEAHPDGDVVIVSHGGTIRWISAEALGFDDRRSARIRGLGNGGVVCFMASANGDHLTFGPLERWDGNTPDLDDPND